MGSLTSSWTVGRILHWKFRRLARLRGIPIIKNRQQDIDTFPIEITRLQVSIPLVYASYVCIVAYAWVVNFHTAVGGDMALANPLIDRIGISWTGNFIAFV
jgi:hypothetical protein